MKIYRIFLITAGILSFGVAIFQAVISFVPEWSAFFGAGDALVSDPPLLLVAGLLMALVFVICGLYALSGAGAIPRMPLLRLGLLGIGLVYTYRGIAFFFQLAIVLGIQPSSQPVPLAHLLSSLVSLIVGLAYLAGLIAGWRWIGSRAQSTKVDRASPGIKGSNPTPDRAESGGKLDDSQAAEVVATWNILNPP